MTTTTTTVHPTSTTVSVIYSLNLNIQIWTILFMMIQGKIFTELPAKSDASTNHGKIVTTKQIQKQHRSPLVPWWRVKSTQKPKRVSKPTVSASTTPKVIWDARAYYFPGALPKLSEVIIFVNQP